jgi:hypothetical protein
VYPKTEESLPFAPLNLEAAPPCPTTIAVDVGIIFKVVVTNPPAPPPPPVYVPPAPPPPTARNSIETKFCEVILNDLGIALTPSEALIVKLYVVSEDMFGKVPEITPVEEFKVTPEGSVEPDAKAYVTVESESVADNADNVIDNCLLNVPKDPLVVCHTGLAFTYNASGIIPNRFDGFVTLISYGS